MNTANHLTLYEMSKKVEKEVLDLLNQNQTGDFIALPNKFSSADLAGQMNSNKVIVEVKHRTTDYNYGEKDGWIVQLSKIKAMCAQVYELNAQPKDVDFLYINKWMDEYYVFDLKDCENKTKVLMNMNAQTYFGAGSEHKIDKVVYKFNNDECLLRRNNLKSIAELEKLYL